MVGSFAVGLGGEELDKGSVFVAVFGEGILVFGIFLIVVEQKLAESDSGEAGVGVAT